MSGYGALDYGSGEYGGPGATFDLASVAAVDSETVDLTFSDSLVKTLAVFTTGSYSIPGVKVFGVAPVSGAVVRLHTSPQTNGKKYFVHVVGDLRGVSSFLPLTNRLGEYTASVGYPAFVVKNLKARPRCEGGKIHLTWTNPTEANAVNVTIHRRAKGYPFDLADGGTEVYNQNGSPAASFLDTGLDVNTFYYYLVVVTPDPGYAPGVNLTLITKNSFAMGLSIEPFNSKDTFFWRHSTRDERVRDALPLTEGGGDGFLERWFAMMGCWLDTLRGWTKSLDTLTNDDDAPLPVIHARVRSLGTEPEGESYDYLTARRMALGLTAQYQIRGSCAGIVDAVKLLTLWDAVCVDLSSGDSCPSGAVSLKTYDGTSALRYGEGVDVTSTFGLLLDPGTIGAVDEWAGGKLLGWMGDVACVESNTVTQAALYTSPKDLETVAELLIGGTLLRLNSVLGVKKGLALEVRDGVNGHISEVASVNAVNKTCVLVTPSIHTFASGTGVSVGKSFIRAEYYSETGVAALVGIVTVVTDADAEWEENQWKGFYFCPETNGSYPILGNSKTELFFGSNITVGAIKYGIATSYGIGATFADRAPHFTYTLSSGYHSTIYNPFLDFQARGSRYDYYSRLYYGPGVNLLGAWGPNDVGVYITTPGIVVTMGEAVGAIGNVFQIDPQQVPPNADDWMGLYLNPNQNQNQLFRIVTNSATEITVAGDITSLAVPGQRYYVLSKRDAMRYQRLDKRLRTEFTEADAKPHLFFT